MNRTTGGTVKLRTGLLGAALSIALAGCGGPARPGPAPPATPLTLSEWRALDVEKKYEPETFERLKLADPRLKDERAWGRFFASVIAPERRKEIPIDLKPKR
jgi:hypothetical protein